MALGIARRARITFGLALLIATVFLFGGATAGYAVDVTFVDPNLEGIVRDTLGIPSPLPVTDGNMLALTRLDALYLNIGDLGGLEYAGNLALLDLTGNHVNNLAAIAGLTNLRELYVDGNQIVSISPLSTLTSLEKIYANDNQISDLSPLAALGSLDSLLLSGNGISDLSPLKGLTGLIDLRLSSDQITDLSPLADLSGLQYLTLSANQIVDISPLSGMPGLRWLFLDHNQINSALPLEGKLGSGSYTDLRYNYLDLRPNSADMQVINAARAGGAWVDCDPQWNTPPTLDRPIGGLAPERLTINELTTLAFTATATDADFPRDTLRFSLGAGAPTGASISTGGAFTWTPGESQGPGVYSITINVSDGRGGTDSEPITVTVDEVNVPPVLAPIGAKTGSELSAISFTAKATDTDVPVNTLTFNLGGTFPEGASIDPQTGLFSWTPTEAQGPGSYPIIVQVNDGKGGSDSEVVTFTIAELNTWPPVLDRPIGGLTGDQLIIDEMTLLTFQVTAADDDIPKNHTYSLALSAPAGATITAGGLFTWTPSEVQGPGVYPVTVVVSDGVASDSELITITVREVNSSPVAVGDAYSTTEDTALNVGPPGVLGNDSDSEGEALHAVKVDGPTHGTASLSPDGSFTYSPAAHFVGTDSFSYRANDDNSDSNVATVSITVNAAPPGGGPGDPPFGPGLLPIYRFYNTRAGVHFYTASLVERDNVVRTWPSYYNYEGIAYIVNTSNPVNSVPLYRFYSPARLTHFYTASEAEKAYVMAHYAHIYRYEGVAYNVSLTPTEKPIWRFYNTGKGVHFYTASSVEKTNVISTWSSIYKLEGISFFIGE